MTRPLQSPVALRIRSVADPPGEGSREDSLPLRPRERSEGGAFATATSIWIAASIGVLSGVGLLRLALLRHLRLPRLPLGDFDPRVAGHDQLCDGDAASRMREAGDAADNAATKFAAMQRRVAQLPKLCRLDIAALHIRLLIHIEELLQRRDVGIPGQVAAALEIAELTALTATLAAGGDAADAALSAALEKVGLSK